MTIWIIVRNSPDHHGWDHFVTTRSTKEEGDRLAQLLNEPKDGWTYRVIEHFAWM